VSPQNLASLINAISSGEISGKIAKKVFEIMVETGDEPTKIIKEKGLKQQSDPKELEKIIIKVLEANSDKVLQYNSGKEKLYGFFVGEIMKASSGSANPKLVNDILKVKLKK
jgi:aspartyl-tRNA(Asn)/glutamyl-tRNA(Gln) amidotransferase subunit B